MDSTPAIGSILLASTEPDRLRDWYQRAFGMTASVDGFLEFGSVGMLIVPRDDVQPRTQEPGRVIINVHVEDARAAVARLDDLGVSWVAELELRQPDGIWFATAIDPDGNYVQIIQLTETHWAAKQQREQAAASTSAAG
jgi:predicted enzyme related to lactoylglutathione lyase